MITISYINWWCIYNDPQDRWFTEFIKQNICNHAKEVLYTDNPDILISSCFEGTPGLQIVKNTKAKIKIFFSGENLTRYTPYDDDNILKDHFDLILTFRYNDFENKMVRFPFWLMYYPFYSINNNNNIISYLEIIHKKNITTPKSMFSTLLSRHDRSGHKSMFLNELAKYGNVMCPSKFNNNCPNIGNGNKNKINFISKSKYNICPENSEYEGYYTEKVFEALESGSVPIYWAISEPEVELLCKNKYCFIKNKDDPVEVNSKIKDVVENYHTYTAGNIFLPDSKTVIQNYYETLKTQIIKLLIMKTNNKIIISNPDYIFDHINKNSLITSSISMDFIHDKIFEYDKDCLDALHTNHRPSYRDIYKRYIEHTQLFEIEQYNNDTFIMHNSYINDKGYIITDEKIYSNTTTNNDMIHVNLNYSKENIVVSIIQSWNFQYQSFATLTNIPTNILYKSKIHVPYINTEIIEWFGILNIHPSKLIVGDIYANTVYIPKMCTAGNPYYSHIKWLQNLVLKPLSYDKYIILVKSKYISNFIALETILNEYCKTNNLLLYIHDVDQLPALTRQHDIFAHAKIVFTPSCIAGNNIISMKPKSWYVELLSNHEINICYSRIAYLCNINYIGISIKNSTVDVTKIQNILNDSII